MCPVGFAAGERGEPMEFGHCGRPAEGTLGGKFPDNLPITLGGQGELMSSSTDVLAPIHTVDSKTQSGLTIFNEPVPPASLPVWWHWCCLRPFVFPEPHRASLG